MQFPAKNRQYILTDTYASIKLNEFSLLIAARRTESISNRGKEPRHVGMNITAKNSKNKGNPATPPSFSSMQNTGKPFEAGSHNRNKKFKGNPLWGKNI